MNIYCRKCGGKNEYSLQKPSFCGGCGESFNAAGPPTKRKIVTEDEYDNKEDSETTARETTFNSSSTGMTKIEFEVEGGPTSIKAGEIFSRLRQEENEQG
tara:strand:+ start:706 stop:1005 length:300 start_codon:yes stop_codon:yes gene_type:complete